MKEHLQHKSNTRMIHVRIPEDLHKRLRIRIAEMGTTIQDWVAMLIRNELNHQKAQKDKLSADAQN